MRVESFIRGMPKAELHIHLEGALEADLMMKFAARNHIKIRFGSAAEIRACYDFKNLQSFLDLYYEGTSTLVTSADFAELTASYLERAAADGVRHAEIFFDPQSHTARGVSYATMMAGICEGLAAGRRDYGISAALIMCFLRHLTEADAFQTLASAMPYRDEIIGVGLDSSEIGNPPIKFARVFAEARRQGFKLVAHAGEEGPPEYISQALDVLHVGRIDHGVRALEQAPLLERLGRERVPLTVCPLSNVKLRVFPSLEQHNLKRLLDAGLMITINSDDPAYFGGYIGDNYVAAQQAFGLSRADLYRIAANSFAASFLPAAQQNSMLGELDRYAANNPA